MGLNVKVHGLKYNFRKVQGCFYKNTVSRDFSKFPELFFY
jgi:hypothetical protein